jgi:hypothetical protein
MTTTLDSPAASTAPSTDSATPPMDPMTWLNKMGVRSWHLYLAGLGSVGASFISWLISRGKRDARAQSDRWGLFVGEWAPTFFAIGVGLKQEEMERRASGVLS